MRRRFTDEDILRVLGAGDSGLKVADLCAAEDISTKTYYSWKVKYGDLTAEELKRQRARERRYQHILLGAGTVVVLGAAYFVLVNVAMAPAFAPATDDALPRDKPAAAEQPARARVGVERARPQGPVAQAPPVPAREAATPVPSRAPAPSAVPVASTPPVAVREPRRGAEARTGGAAAEKDDGIQASDPDGFAVQVAAVSALPDSRALLDRLARDGYPGYITRKTDGQTTLYRVRVGPFESRRLAEGMIDRLRRDGYGKAWIAK